MNVQTSIGSPVCWVISATGSMSRTMVRAAQFARIRSRESTISRASRVTSATTWGPAPGRPMSAVSMPSWSMSRRISILRSISGALTEGDCRPSRSVSSSNWIANGGRSQRSPASFQS